MNLKHIGYEIRYAGWPDSHWEFRSENPEPLPACHNTAYVRKVYADISSTKKMDKDSDNTYTGPLINF